jgi:hypothetical protein
VSNCEYEWVSGHGSKCSIMSIFLIGLHDTNSNNSQVYIRGQQIMFIIFVHVNISYSSFHAFCAIECFLGVQSFCQVTCEVVLTSLIF